MSSISFNPYLVSAEARVRARSASGPPTRASASQRLMVSSATPKPSAMSRRCRPSCLGCHARSRRYPRQSSWIKSDASRSLFYRAANLTRFAQRSVITFIGQTYLKRKNSLA
jgi:hypothetical protein